MNEDSLIEAQRLIDPTVLSTDSPTQLKPEEGRPGGEGSHKGLSLVGESLMLYPLIIVLSLLLAFFVGFLVGSTMKERRLLPVVDSVIRASENSKQMYSTAQIKELEYVPPKQTPVAIHAISTSSVMKYKSPQQIRMEKEREAKRVIEQNTISMRSQRIIV